MSSPYEVLKKNKPSAVECGAGDRSISRYICLYRTHTSQVIKLSLASVRKDFIHSGTALVSSEQI